MASVTNRKRAGGLPPAPSHAAWQQHVARVYDTLNRHVNTPRWEMLIVAQVTCQ
jgi:hypothetical protein